jgi:predicted DNA-binding antitoxin AbrB/MazE fold protein
MTKSIEAVFDGETLRPDEPLELPPNTRVRVTIESLPVPEEAAVVRPAASAGGNALCRASRERTQKGRL